MRPAEMIPPEAVEVPRIYEWTVFHQTPNWALASGVHIKTNVRVLGVRWNGDSSTPQGYPNRGAYPCWFVLPEEIGDLLLNAPEIGTGKSP